MRQVVRWLQVRADGLLGPALAHGPGEYEPLHDLAGYILEQPYAFPGRELVSACGYLVLVTRGLGEPDARADVPVQPRSNGPHRKTLQLRPVGRLVPVRRSLMDSRNERGGPTYSTLFERATNDMTCWLFFHMESHRRSARQIISSPDNNPLAMRFLTSSFWLTISVSVRRTTDQSCEGNKSRTEIDSWVPLPSPAVVGDSDETI